jgi:hypothetical protein
MDIRPSLLLYLHLRRAAEDTQTNQKHLCVDREEHTERLEYLLLAVGGTRKIRNTTLTQEKVLNTFNSTVRAQSD